MTGKQPEKGTEQNPLTREDVLQAIEENGGTADELDLSGEWFEDGIDLSALDLKNARFHGASLFRANFNGSILDRAQFLHAKLKHATFNPSASRAVSLQKAIFRDADLTNAEFQEANLTKASFQEQTGQSIRPANLQNTDFRGATLRLADFGGCRFYGTKFEGAYLRGAKIYDDTHLEEADWGNYHIGEETCESELRPAQIKYRELKVWYTSIGADNTAGKFFYREQESKRKYFKAVIS
jgi:uncharacterized protein YjbI with pentapeptide repeats